MVKHEPAFKENFHMDVQNFNYIFDKIKHRFNYKCRRLNKKSSRPDMISAKQKLAMVLEYVNMSVISHCAEIN